MKTGIAVSLLAALALGGCTPPSDAAKPQTVAADQVPVHKKKCADQMGSRLAPCGEGSTGDYTTSTSGQAYKDYMVGRSNLGATNGP